ncbi:MAG TPA: hypothetical protein PLV83_00090 [Bacilli bacterium]|nr:hypothetical protein [Bacilli bacterium]
MNKKDLKKLIDNHFEKVEESEKTADEEEKEYYQKMIERLNGNKEKYLSIATDDKYIKWLENYTLFKPCFNNQDASYYPENYDAEDLENIKNLSILFNVANNYKEKYRLDAYKDYVSIKYNGIGYDLEMIRKPELICYCKRTEPTEDSIDYNDIINNKKNEIALEEINKKICQFIILRNELVELGVSSKQLSDIAKEDPKQYNYKRK